MSGENLSSGTAASSSPTISAKTQLLNSFQGDEYRHAFLAEHVRAFIALQVRALRKERKISQTQLGELMGKAQAWISRLEDPDYGKVTIATLLDLAEAFDTALVIRFATFSELLDRLVTLSPEDYSVVSFRDDNFVQVAPLVQAAKWASCSTRSIADARSQLAEEMYREPQPKSIRVRVSQGRAPFALS